MRITSKKLNDVLRAYDYTFPAQLIAQKPASPRDAAKLLVYHRKTGKISYSTFRNIAAFLPKNSVLVFNETKVLPARLKLKKVTGGMVRVLYLRSEAGSLLVMADRKLTIDSKVFLNARIWFTVLRQEGKYYYLKPSFPVGKFFDILERHGETPLPPYIKHPALTGMKLREAYQAVFARQTGSVAAPTASLHFTKKILGDLKKAGHDCVFVTLHVNLGTFAPLTQEQIQRGRLHTESYAMDKRTAAFLHEARKEGRPIIAVGTTVVRTLESAADAHGKLKKLSGATDLFIRTGYRFKFVDGMITNFHVPRSSLLMLVAAFAGREKLFELYRRAIGRNFRLFSFGDGMFIR